jgi:endonuclease YncB( thermonuclease family)
MFDELLLNSNKMNFQPISKYFSDQVNKNKDPKKLRECTFETTPYYSLKNQTKLCRVMSVYDGDSITIATIVNEVPTMFKCRLEGIDTPELKPRLGIERRQEHIQRAKKARNRVAQLITDCDIPLESDQNKLDIAANSKLIQVKCGDFDKYGRLLINIPHESQTVSQILIQEKLANVYGGGTKLPW